MSINDSIGDKRGLGVIHPLLLVTSHPLFLPITLILYFSSMASTIPLVRDYAFVVLRFRICIKYNSLTSFVILCRYVNTKNMFPIGRTPIATDSRYCR